MKNLREFGKWKWTKDKVLRFISMNKRAFLVFAAVVVFFTTYALILPAITLERNKAENTPGIDMDGHEKGLSTGDLDGSQGVDPDMDPAGSNSASASADHESGEWDFAQNLGDLRVQVAADGAFPADTEMKLAKARLDEDLEKAVLYAAMDATGAEDDRVKIVQAMDISFWANDEEVEPGAEVRVAFDSEAFGSMKAPVVAHLLTAEPDEDGNYEIEVLVPVDEEDLREEEQGVKGLVFYQPVDEESIRVSKEDLEDFLADDENDENHNNENDAEASGAAAAEQPEQEKQNGAQEENAAASVPGEGGAQLAGGNGTESTKKGEGGGNGGGSTGAGTGSGSSNAGNSGNANAEASADPASDAAEPARDANANTANTNANENTNGNDVNPDASAASTSADSEAEAGTGSGTAAQTGGGDAQAKSETADTGSEADKAGSANAGGSEKTADASGSGNAGSGNDSASSNNAAPASGQSASAGGGSDAENRGSSTANGGDTSNRGSDSSNSASSTDSSSGKGTENAGQQGGSSASGTSDKASGDGGTGSTAQSNNDNRNSNKNNSGNNNNSNAGSSTDHSNSGANSGSSTSGSSTSTESGSDHSGNSNSGNNGTGAGSSSAANDSSSSGKSSGGSSSSVSGGNNTSGNASSGSNSSESSSGSSNSTSTSGNSTNDSSANSGSASNGSAASDSGSSGNGNSNSTASGSGNTNGGSSNNGSGSTNSGSGNSGNGNGNGGSSSTSGSDNSNSTSSRTAESDHSSTNGTGSTSNNSKNTSSDNSTSKTESNSGAKGGSASSDSDSSTKSASTSSENTSSTKSGSGSAEASDKEKSGAGSGSASKNNDSKSNDSKSSDSTSAKTERVKDAAREIRFHADSFSIYCLVETESIVRTVDRPGRDTYVLSAEGDGCFVKLRYTGKAGIPEGAELYVNEIPEGSEEFAAYYGRAQAQEAEAAASGNAQRGLSSARFFDIRIFDVEGEEIEPKAPVEVQIFYDNDDIRTDSGEIGVFYYGDEKIEKIESEIKTSSRYEEGSTPDDDRTPDSDSTPDSDNAVDNERTEGDDRIADNDRTADAPAYYGIASASDIDDAANANASISNSGRDHNDNGYDSAAGGEISAAREAYLAGIAVEEDALSFVTGKTSVFGILGIASGSFMTASDGQSYRVSVFYDDAAGIPEDAALAVRPIPGAEIGSAEAYQEYQTYMDRAADLLPEDEGLAFARLFDIRIQSPDGEELRLSAPVRVEIALLDEEGAEILRQDADAVQILCFAGENGDFLELIEDAEKDGNAITFQTEELSVCAVLKAEKAEDAENVENAENAGLAGADSAAGTSQGAQGAAFAERSITDSSGSVRVTGKLPENATVTARALTGAEITALESDGTKVVFAYDITIWVDGEEYQPEEAVSVEVLQLKTEKKVTIAHMETNDMGEITSSQQMESMVGEDGNVAFMAESFSIYIGTVQEGNPVLLKVGRMENYGIYTDEACTKAITEDNLQYEGAASQYKIDTDEADKLIYVKAKAGFTIQSVTVQNAGANETDGTASAATAASSPTGVWVLTFPKGLDKNQIIHVEVTAMEKVYFYIPPASGDAGEDGADTTGHFYKDAMHTAYYYKGTTEEEYLSLTELISSAAAPLIVQLDSDYLVANHEGTSVTVAAGKTITIDLNGNVLFTGTERALSNNGTLTILDSDPEKIHKGIVSSNSVWVRKEGASGSESGYTELKGGLVASNGQATDGIGRVLANNKVNSKSAILILEGGTITGGYTNKWGGGINNAGEMYITGGSVSYCYAGAFGGGVYSTGTITMNGGLVDHCCGGYLGGGFFLEGQMTMSGGKISYNISRNSTIAYGSWFGYSGYESDWDNRHGGAGIYTNSILRINGGEITENLSERVGGGIHGYRNSRVYIYEGAKINHNQAAGDRSGWGGGIYTNGKVYIDGGEFCNNIADVGGGAINSYWKTPTNEVVITKCKIVGNVCNGKEGQCSGGYYGGGALDIENGTMTINCEKNEDVIIENNICKFNGASESGRGGGIFFGKWGNARIVNLEGGIIQNNSSEQYGGGIYLQQGTINLSGAEVYSNTAVQNGGGVYIQSGTFTMNSGGILGKKGGGNQAKRYGGGIYLENGTVNVKGGEIAGNSSAVSGGGMYINSGILNMSGGVVKANTAVQNGGGAYLGNGSFNMTGGELGTEEDGNSAANGGGAYLNNGNFTLNGAGAKVHGNIAATDGAGIYLAGGTPNLQKGSMEKNVARQNGGALYINNKDVNINLALGASVEISGNRAGYQDLTTPVEAGTGGDGAGIYISGNGNTGKFTVSGSNQGTVHFTGNQAKGNGGGIAVNNGAFTVSPNSGSVSIEKNGADFGGGIHVSGTNGSVTVNAGSIKENTSVQDGAGIYLATGTMELTGCDLTGNTAGRNGGGAYLGSGIFNFYSGNVEDNKAAEDGGGIYLANATPKLYGGTMRGNIAGQNGGGMYIHEKDVSISLESGKTLSVSGNYAGYQAKDTKKADGTGDGGGLYVSGNAAGTAGSFTVGAGNQGTVDITGNKAKNNGGGIHVNNGKFSTASALVSIVGNEADNGGGVYVSGDKASVSVSGGKIGIGLDGAGNANKAVKDGGGVYLSGGDFLLEDAEAAISYNVAGQHGGGVYLTGGTPKLNAGALSHNRASGNGGGIYIDRQRVRLTPTGEVEIADNGAANGAGIYIGGSQSGSQSGDFDASFGVDKESTGNVVLEKNQATGDGGGVCIVYGEFDVDSDKITVQGNGAEHGGGVAVLFGSFKLSESSIGTEGNGNSALEAGGGVYISGGNAEMSGGSVRENEAPKGGGVYVNDGAFTMSAGTLLKNRAQNAGQSQTQTQAQTQNARQAVAMQSLRSTNSTGSGTGADGGGVYVAGGTVSITSGSIQENTATGDGGGMYILGGDFTMTGGNVDKNEASGDGGGVYVKNTGVTFGADSGQVQVSYNKAANGGGFYFDQGEADEPKQANIVNGWIEENQVTGNGGGIYQRGGMAESSVTGRGIISSNTAANGGGFYIHDGTLQLSGGVIKWNKASSASGEVTLETAYDSDENIGVGGGVYVHSGTFMMEAKVAASGNGSSVGMYGNLADFAADDIYASKDGMLLVPNVQNMDLEDYGNKIGKIDGWFEDFPGPNDTKYPAPGTGAWEGKQTATPYIRYRDAGDDNAKKFGIAATDAANNQIDTRGSANKYICMTLGFKYDYTELTIRKVVTEAGSAFDREERSYTFKLAIPEIPKTAEDFNTHKFQYQIVDKNDRRGEEIPIEKASEQEQYEVEIPLKNGEYAIITGLEVGKNIRIEEMVEDSEFATSIRVVPVDGAEEQYPSSDSGQSSQNNLEAWPVSLRAVMTFTNTKQKMHVRLYKKGVDNTDAAGTAKPLQGAAFTIYKDSDGTEVYEGNVNIPANGTGTTGTTGTDATGLVFDGYLAAGTYYLKETKVPGGYNMPLGMYKITIGEDWKVTLDRSFVSGQTNIGDVRKEDVTGGGTVDAVDLYNVTGVELPSSGGPGTKAYALGGIALIAASAMMYGFRTRRRRKEVTR